MSLTKKFFVVATLFIVSACSKEAAPPAMPATPLIERDAADAKPAEELRGEFAPGGIQASYRATFSEGTIKRLEETRQPSAQTGAYEFVGARLMKYRGAALGSGANIELEFDERGKVLVARAGDKDVSAEEITAIRDRAQSLRSHVVAQRDVHGHGKR